MKIHVHGNTTGDDHFHGRQNYFLRYFHVVHVTFIEEVRSFHGSIFVAPRKIACKKARQVLAAMALGMTSP